MLKSSFKGRIYFFVCNNLWDVLSLFHYLNEEVATESLGSFYLEKWGAPYEDLAHWALEERWFPIDREKVPREEKDLLLSTADQLGDLLASHWSDKLKIAALEARKRYPSVSESMWLYYLYCGFLRQVLREFDRVLREQGSSTAYCERYQEHIGLFDDLVAALEQERPFLDTQTDVSNSFKESAWGDLDAHASNLGAEWRQAVHSVARDLELPTFSGNS
jgi:hypothetical protein